MNPKNFIVKFISKLSPRLYFIIAYVHNRGRIPHLRNPKDLSEIWIKFVLDGKVMANYELADKLLVRKYVERRGLEKILVPLIGTYESVRDIDFSLLPDKFALKANFGAGMNIICQDKSTLNTEKVKNVLETWMNIPSYSYSEAHYNRIKRRIICEEFIDDGTGGFPIDYKFMCIKGNVFCILVCSSRETGHADYIPYTTKWEPLFHYCKKAHSPKEIVQKPNNLNEMIYDAQLLSRDIELVRVDLYSNGNRVWFGEMTLTPAGCIFHRWTKRALDEMGAFYFQK